MTTTDYIAEHLPRFQEELYALLRIPSISTAKEHDRDTHRCAVLVQEHLVRAGVSKAELYPTDRLNRR